MISNGLREFRDLQFLILNFGCCKDVNDDGIIRIVSTVKTFKILKSFYLSLYALKSITDNSILELANCVKKLKELVYLEIDLSQCKSLNDISINLLWMSIGTLTLLKGICISVWGIKNLTLESFHIMCQQIDNMPYLDSLGLVLRNSIIESGVLLTLGQIISRLALIELSMNCYDCVNIMEGDIFLFIKSVSTISTLKTLRLYIRGCKNVTNDSFKVIKRQLKKSLKLQSFLVE